MDMVGWATAVYNSRFMILNRPAIELQPLGKAALKTHALQRFAQPGVSEPREASGVVDLSALSVQRGTARFMVPCATRNVRALHEAPVRARAYGCRRVPDPACGTVLVQMMENDRGLCMKRR